MLLTGFDCFLKKNLKQTKVVKNKLRMDKTDVFFQKNWLKEVKDNYNFENLFFLWTKSLEKKIRMVFFSKATSAIPY